MIRAGLLLAAGQSARFGSADKLRAPLRGRPLVAHAAEALRAAGCDLLIAATRDTEVAALLDEFESIRPEQDDQSASLRAGTAYAEDRGADRVLVALGDMPLVTPDLLRAIAERCTETRAAAATDGTRAMPPACFPRPLFAELRALTGDRGARALLDRLPEEALIAAPAGTLTDIDTKADLAALDAARVGVP